MLARRVKGEIGPFKHRRLSCPAGRPIDERVTFRIETLLPIVNDDYDGKKKKKTEEETSIAGGIARHDIPSHRADKGGRVHSRAGAERRKFGSIG